MATAYLAIGYIGIGYFMNKAWKMNNNIILKIAHCIYLFVAAMVIFVNGSFAFYYSCKNMNDNKLDRFIKAIISQSIMICFPISLHIGIHYLKKFNSLFVNETGDISITQA